MNLFVDNKNIWEGRYSRGESINRYPYDRIVGFVLKYFGAMERRCVRILDYGAGGGNNTLFLAKEGFDYYAVDYSKSALSIIEKHLRENGVEPDMDRIRCGEFASLPFTEKFFDLVLDRQAMDQNNAEVIPSLVKEIYRVLKPGGTYFGVNFADRHPILRFGQHLGNNDYINFTKGPFVNGGLRHFFSCGELRTIFSAFEITDIQFFSIRSMFNPDSSSDEVIITARRPERP